MDDEDSNDTWVLGNVNSGSAPELMIVVADGAGTEADDWDNSDFIL